MKIKEFMTANPITININASLDVAADVMSRNDIGIMPVEDDGKLAGIITDRDIVLRAVASRRDPVATRVGDIMTPELYYCYDDEEVSSAAKLMEDKQVRRVVVFDRKNRPAGMLSVSDIVVHGDKDTACEVLERVSVPVHSMPAEAQPGPVRTM